MESWYWILLAGVIIAAINIFMRRRKESKHQPPNILPEPDNYTDFASLESLPSDKSQNLRWG